jgi:ADP-heptose:LPS heptosyltransferase
VGTAVDGRKGRTATSPVVVLRALGLGDVLTAVPALRALRRRFPDRPLLLAGPRAPAQLLKQYGIVDGVIATSGLSSPPPGRGLSGHLAVNAHGRGPQSHRLLLAGSPSRVLAYANREVAVPGPIWNPREHEVHRWCRLAAWGAGDIAATLCDPTDLFLEYVPERRGRSADGSTGCPGAASGQVGSAPGRRTGAVVIHPGSASVTRRWPGERFAAVAASLARRGIPVVVTGGSAEASMCRRLASRAGLGSAADLSGRLTLPNLVTLLRRSRLLICGDTGVAHLATALRTPSVLLFGLTEPAQWGPLVDPHLHRVLWHGPSDQPDRQGGSGDPGGTLPDPTLLEITVREATDAVLSQLADSWDASIA